MYSTCNTAKFPGWLNSQNQVFSLVETMSLISQSLSNFSQPGFHHTCLSHTYIYMPCISHFVEVKHTILKVQYNKKRSTNSKEQAELYKLRDNSMTFASFLPEPSPHTQQSIYLLISPHCLQGEVEFWWGKVIITKVKHGRLVITESVKRGWNILFWWQNMEKGVSIMEVDGPLIIHGGNG